MSGGLKGRGDEDGDDFENGDEDEDEDENGV